MIDSETILRATGLALGYGANLVLRDVNLEVRAGEFWFLLGANGAGKTSFLRAVLGFMAPQAGTLWQHPEHARRERMGFVPQRCDLNPTLPTTVREFVSLGCVGLRLPAAERRDRLRWALDRVGLGSLEGRDYWSLSGGLRQRALVARALVRRPALLVLDEPTNGLDPATEDTLLRLLAELNREARLTLLFVTHDVVIATRFASHVALFHHGTAIAGSRAEVLNPRNLARVYGLESNPDTEAGAPAIHSIGGHG